MKTVAVIFGGRSTEHDVSVITALASVIKPLKLTGQYNIVPVYISKDGAWYSDDKLSDIAFYSSESIAEYIKKAQPIAVRFDSGMTIIKAGGITGRGQQIGIDIAFPAMHGTYGEDGALMGLLEMAGIPYVGCDVAASAVAMDKVLAKQVAQAHGIATPRFIALTTDELQQDYAAAIKHIEITLHYPLFIKPPHLGSSIGISRATNRLELRNGLEVAAHYDSSVLVEEAVANLIEVTLPIIGNQEARPALLEQPLTDSEDFFDFDTKYMRGGKKGGKAGGTKMGKGAQGYSELPAVLPGKLYQAAEATGLAVYRALGCSGIARVDMLIDSKTKNVYFNEVNPLPGSLYAHNWRAAGVSGVELMQQLIGYAEKRHAARQALQTSFTTNYLQQF